MGLTQSAHLILFVEDQSRSTDFYRTVLAEEPRLNVPGMTEFQLTSHCVLGLMPQVGIQKLLGEGEEKPKHSHLHTGFMAECYLVVEDPDSCISRAVGMGAELLSPVQLRDWGHRVGYCRDLDGYILAFAEGG